jgi:hypothetical protein
LLLSCPSACAVNSASFAPVAAEGAGQLRELSDAEVETLIAFFSHAHDQRVKRARLIREQTARLAAAGQDTP